MSARGLLCSDIWWCWEPSGSHKLIFASHYTLKTNRLKPSLMTKSHTGTWRVEYKLIRTGTLGTKKEKLQTKGLEDGGSGGLKKYKRVCMCVCMHMCYTHIYVCNYWGRFYFPKMTAKIISSHMPFLQCGLDFCPFKWWDLCTWLELCDWLDQQR